MIVSVVFHVQPFFIKGANNSQADCICFLLDIFRKLLQTLQNNLVLFGMSLIFLFFITESSLPLCESGWCRPSEPRNAEDRTLRYNIPVWSHHNSLSQFSIHSQWQLLWKQLCIWAGHDWPTLTRPICSWASSPIHFPSQWSFFFFEGLGGQLHTCWMKLMQLFLVFCMLFGLLLWKYKNALYHENIHPLYPGSLHCLDTELLPFTRLFSIFIPPLLLQDLYSKLKSVRAISWSLEIHRWQSTVQNDHEQKLFFFLNMLQWFPIVLILWKVTHWEYCT